ncbi:hypothetical protein [Candidatus Phytoplasma tritici]|uniref:hypothetical protein n=1 Tax=Candidatus Phytoplasma tritici TaxID=321961 RepID=UPI0004679049|nr:hypothetical protein [Candidatus Phytoplasma tritici]
MKNISLLVVYSVSTLVPEAEVGGDMVNIANGFTKSRIRFGGQSMRKQSRIINKIDTVFIYINQLREKNSDGFW